MKNTKLVPIKVTHYRFEYMNNDTGEVVSSRWEVVRNTISNLIHYHFWSTNWVQIPVVDKVTVEMLKPLFLED